MGAGQAASDKSVPKLTMTNPTYYEVAALAHAVWTTLIRVGSAQSSLMA